jgi:hypothetical protein
MRLKFNLAYRYECSQTIECGLPLSRVLDALQLLGPAHFYPAA